MHFVPNESNAGSLSTSNSYIDIEAVLLPLNGSDGSYYSKSRRSLPACGKSLAVASLVISLFCLLVVGSCCCWLFFFGSDMLTAKDEVCLPCMQVKADPLDMSFSSRVDGLEVKYDAENDTDMCCARTAAQYATLFKLILKRQQEVKKILDVLGSIDNGETAGMTQATSVAQPGPSAHLLFTPRSEEEQNSKTSLLQHWKSPRDHPFSHIRGDLGFHDNMIYIKTSGLYFVYCQIMYTRIDSNLADDFQIASHYVKRDSIAYPPNSGIMLKSRHTRFNKKEDRHSNYVSGLFFLHGGDRLYVESSQPSLISYDEVASFFGLFKVAD